MCTRHKKNIFAAETIMSIRTRETAPSPLSVPTAATATEIQLQHSHHTKLATCFECNNNKIANFDDSGASIDDYDMANNENGNYCNNNKGTTTKEVDLDNSFGAGSPSLSIPAASVVPVINFDDGNNFPPIQHKTISDPRNKVDDVSDAVTDRSVGIFVDDKHEIIPTQFCPAPSLPLLLASGKRVPSHCFNPFNSSAPDGFWKKIERDVTESTASLLGSKAPQPFLFLHFDTITNRAGTRRIHWILRAF